MTASVDQLAASLTALASGIEARQPDASLLALLAKTQALCECAGASEGSAARKQRLAQVRTATETWHTVWPRLGGQRDFRLAVAREARLWSKRITSAAQK